MQVTAAVPPSLYQRSCISEMCMRWGQGELQLGRLSMEEASQWRRLRELRQRPGAGQALPRSIPSGDCSAGSVCDAETRCDV